MRLCLILRVLSIPHVIYFLFNLTLRVVVVQHSIRCIISATIDAPEKKRRVEMFDQGTLLVSMGPNLNNHYRSPRAIVPPGDSSFPAK